MRAASPWDRAESGLSTQHAIAAPTAPLEALETLLRAGSFKTPSAFRTLLSGTGGYSMSPAMLAGTVRVFTSCDSASPFDILPSATAEAAET